MNMSQYLENVFQGFLFIVLFYHYVHKHPNIDKILQLIINMSTFRENIQIFTYFIDEYSKVREMTHCSTYISITNSGKFSTSLLYPPDSIRWILWISLRNAHTAAVCREISPLPL